MMKMPIYDTESGKLVGEKEVPDEIIECAAKVAAWMEQFGHGVELCGLTLT